MRYKATVLAFAIAVLCAASASAQISADNIIMRIRTVCNQGQGGTLLASFEIKPRSNMWPPNFGRIGGFCATFTYTSEKLVLQGVGQRYETGYWNNPYRSQAFGSSAWFNQHAQYLSPGAALPVEAQYFNPSTDCLGNPIGDGFFEIMYYQLNIMPTANGTVNLGLYDVRPYKTIGYMQNIQMSAIFNADLSLNTNDSVEVVNGLLIPVELSAFNVTPRADGSMLLSWHTETETSNLGFEIERGDGTQFDRIGYVAGRGTTTEPHTYTWVEDQPRSTRSDNIVYYRLKQIDTDGTASYTEAQPAEILPSFFGLEQTYPNPATVGQTTSIPYALVVPASVNLAVYNAMGQKVASLVDGVERQAGRHVASWNGRNDRGDLVAAGVYFVRFSAGVGGDRISESRQISVIR